MATIRSAKEAGPSFPYSSKRVCYILVKNDGSVEQLTHLRGDSDKNLDACKLVEDGKAQIYAAWPGQYRSDLFIIDDISKLIEYFYTGREPN